MPYHKLVRNLRKRDEAAARLIPGFDRRWIVEGPNVWGLCTAVNVDTAEVVCFKLNVADGSAEIIKPKGNTDG